MEGSFFCCCSKDLKFISLSQILKTFYANVSLSLLRKRYSFYFCCYKCVFLLLSIHSECGRKSSPLCLLLITPIITKQHDDTSAPSCCPSPLCLSGSGFYQKQKDMQYVQMMKSKWMLKMGMSHNATKQKHFRAQVMF